MKKKKSSKFLSSRLGGAYIWTQEKPRHWHFSALQWEKRNAFLWGSLGIMTTRHWISCENARALIVQCLYAVVCVLLRSVLVVPCISPIIRCSQRWVFQFFSVQALQIFTFQCALSRLNCSTEVPISTVFLNSLFALLVRYSHNLLVSDWPSVDSILGSRSGSLSQDRRFGSTSRSIYPSESFESSHALPTGEK